MATIKVLSGDLERGKWTFTSMFGTVIMSIPSTTKHLFKGERVDFSTELQSIEALTEERVKKLAGTAGWGLAGAALLGPLGAIGGMLIGGNKQEVCFLCHLKDGRKFIGTTDNKTWQKLISVPLLATSAQLSDDMRKCPFCAELIKPEAKLCKHCGSEVPALTHATEIHLSLESMSAPETHPASSPVEALTVAAWDGDLATVSRLLSEGVDVNQPNSYGKTALEVARSQGYELIVNLLLSHGAADPDA